MLDGLGLQFIKLEKFTHYEEAEAGTSERNEEKIDAVKWDEYYLRLRSKTQQEEYLVNKDNLFDFIFGYTIWYGSQEVRVMVANYFIGHNFKKLGDLKET